MRVQHQRFVGAGFGCLDAGGDAVELAVAVELRVLHVGIAATHVHGEQAQALRQRFGLGDLELRDDHHGRRAHGDARVLVGRALHAARHHQPQMHAVAHAVGVQRGVERLRQLRTIHADIQRDRFRALVQPVEVFVEKDRVPVDHPQTFPHAIAQHETAVEYRHRGFGPRFQRPVDPDADVRIARVVVEVVDALRHRPLLSVCCHWRSDECRASGRPARGDHAGLLWPRLKGLYSLTFDRPEPNFARPATGQGGRGKPGPSVRHEHYHHPLIATPEARHHAKRLRGAFSLPQTSSRYGSHDRHYAPRRQPP